MSERLGRKFPLPLLGNEPRTSLTIFKNTKTKANDDDNDDDDDDDDDDNNNNNESKANKNSVRPVLFWEPPKLLCSKGCGL